MTATAPPDTLGAIFERLAATRGDDVMLRGISGTPVTHAGFHDRTERLCAAVAARGIAPGARVAVLSKNSIAFAEVFGLVRLGLVVVPLNWRLAAGDLHRLLDDCAPEILIVDRAHLDVVRNHAATLGSLRLRLCFDGPQDGFEGYEAFLSGAGAPPKWPVVAPSEPASIIYTSGTTGRPKGAVISHRGALANMRAAQAELLQLSPGDRALAVMPFFHVGGLWYHFLAAVSAGCETTILPEFAPTTVLETLKRDRITVVHLVPTMIDALLTHPGFAPGDLPGLRRIFYAGSPMPEALLRRAMAALEGCEFLQAYGSTEAGVVSALTPLDHRRALQDDAGPLLRSCGLPVAGCEVRVAGAHPEIGIGEIEVRSDGIFDSYWRRPDATQEVLSGGWVATGDLGRLDPAGYIFLIDRKNDMIVTGGENVFPTEVEDHLLRIDGIAEAAVFSTPHPRWVEQVTAAVVPTPGARLDAADIAARLRADLAPYKCPKEIFFADRLPRNGAGKVVRAELRKLYASGKEMVG